MKMNIILNILKTHFLTNRRRSIEALSKPVDCTRLRCALYEIYCSSRKRIVCVYKRTEAIQHAEVWQLGWSNSIFHHQAQLNPYTMITSAVGSSHLPDADSRRLYLYSREEGPDCMMLRIGVWPVDLLAVGIGWASRSGQLTHPSLVITCCFKQRCEVFCVFLLARQHKFKLYAIAWRNKDVCIAPWEF